MDDTALVHIEGQTIVDALRKNVRRIPGRPALRTRVARGWHTISYADYGRAVAEVTAGLAELGIEAGEHVGIFSNNRAEWHLADLGSLANGCVTVPVYQTSSSVQVAYLLGHGEANLCFVEDHDL
ncbi:MAG: AMP-binding protein, partial [Ilumatobacteraceae bacterium]